MSDSGCGWKEPSNGVVSKQSIVSLTAEFWVLIEGGAGRARR